MKTRNSPIIASTNNNDDEAKSSPQKAPPPSLSLDDVVDADTTAADSSPTKRRKIDLEQKIMMSDETTTTVSTAAVGGGGSANHENDLLVEAASSSTNVTTTNNNSNNNTAVPSSNVHKTATAAVSSSSNTKIETIDVATILGVKPGDRIEVKWNINEEDDDDDDDAEEDPSSLMIDGEKKKKMGLPKTEGEDDVEPLPQQLATNNNTNSSSSSASSPAPTGMVSVWWKATIQKATGTYHILDDEEATSSSGGVDSSTFGAVAAVNAYNSAKKPSSSSSSAATATTSSSANNAGKDEKVYNCPKCAKHSMSKQGLYTHYGMVHGGKLSRDYPNLDFLNPNNTNNNQKKALPNVRVPIYEIVYDPLPQMGFPDYSTEEIAFISNVTLLNLSTEEMMNFRKEGDLASPAASSSSGTGSPVDAVLEGDGGNGGLLFADEVTAAATTTTSNNPNEICKEFRTEDDIRQYMNELMQKTMVSTGLNSRMDTLPRSQQNVIATRINKALEGLLGKIMEETGRMEGGSRVVTAEVVRRCMDQMGRV